MAALILPRRFYSQPEYPAEIAHEFSGSLVHALNGALASTTQIYDHAQQKMLAIQAASANLSTAASVGLGKYGKYVKTDRSPKALDGGEIVLGSAMNGFGALDQYTIIAHLNRTAAVETGIIGAGFGAAHVDGTTQVQWWSDNKHYFDIVNTTQRVAYVDADAGDLARAWTWDGAADRKIIYKNGVAVIEDTADPDVLTAGTNTYYAIGNGLGCYSFLVFNRLLDKSTVNALSQNPGQIFRAKPRVLYFDVGAGGATIVAADANSSGVATATGVSGATAGSSGASEGIATTSGAGAGLIPSNGASAGVATTTGVGAGVGAASGASDGVAVANGVSGAIQGAVGASSGSTTANGVGADGAAAETPASAPEEVSYAPQQKKTRAPNFAPRKLAPEAEHAKEEKKPVKLKPKAEKPKVNRLRVANNLAAQDSMLVFMEKLRHKQEIALQEASDDPNNQEIKRLIMYNIRARAALLAA